MNPLSKHLTTRRAFLKNASLVGMAAGSLPFLSGCQTPNLPLPIRPNYILFQGENQDFYLLFNAEKEGSDFDLAGVNITFGFGTPVFAPDFGTIKLVKDYSLDGQMIVLDSGSVAYSLSHFDQMFVKPGDKVDEQRLIGTEGKSGVLSRGNSHTHSTLIGNAYFYDETIGKRYNSHSSYWLFWEFLLNPDKHSNGNLFMHNYWDGVADNSAFHQKSREGLDAIDLFIGKYGIEYRFPETIDKLHTTTVHQINHFHDETKKQWKSLSSTAKKEADRIGDIFREAGQLFRIPSTLFINPDSPEMIAKYKEWNPQHAALIGKYYDRFLPGAKTQG